MKHLKRLLAVLLAAALTAAASTSLAAPAGTALLAALTKI